MSFGVGMPELVDVLLLTLAVWRASYFFVNEEGPGGIGRKLRERAGIGHDEDTRQPISYPETFFAQLLGCVWCVSFWVAIVMFSLWLSLVGVPVVIVVALSGGAVLLDTLQRRIDR
jgi:hypothetical protein